MSLTAFHFRTGLRWLTCISLFLAFCATAVSAQQPGPDPNQPATPARGIISSLDFVPADTAFYFATSNHQRIWKSLTESRAYSSLQDSPAGRKMRKAYRKGLARGWDQFGENPFRYYLEGYANSIDSVQGKLVMPYLERLLSHELFVYGDNRIVPFIQSLGAYYSELNSAVLDTAEQANEEDLWKAIETVGDKHLRGLEVPTVVLGAITDDPEVFVGFVELIHTGLQQQIRENPADLTLLEKAVRYHSEGTTADSRLAWVGVELAGDDLPFDNLTEFDPELEPLLGAVRPFFSGKQFAFAFAVRGQVVLMTFGPSLEHIRKLGVGPILLDQPQLSPLRQARVAGQQVCLASYQSTEFSRMFSSSWSGWAQRASFLLNQIIASARSELLTETEQLELKRKFEAETEQFARELQAIEAQSGAWLAYGLLTPEGIEGFSCEFEQPADESAGRPLLLPNRLAAPPLLAFFHRNQADSGLWKILGDYLGKFFAGVQEYGPLLAEDLERAEISAIILERLAPLLQGLCKTTFAELMPQMAGEEWGVIIDLSVARKSWHPAMPPASNPLPMPGAMLLMQFQDATLIKQVGHEYLTLARKLLQDIQDLGTSDLPGTLTLSDPEKQTLSSGEQYSIRFTAGSGSLADWKPHALLGQGLVALGYFPEQTARLLEVPQADSENPAPDQSSISGSWLFGPAKESTASTSGLFFLDNRQIADALEAWLNYGLEQAKANGLTLDMKIPADSNDLNLNESELRETWSRAIAFYRVFEGYSSRTYHQDNTRVRHFLLKFSDR